ncbi:MAG TPA: precorrin-6A reductase [Methanothermococcus okinawensis]|uniref:Precorrin-6A reductase n=1 Tax=Methanothermococcus okinawensis TaxID=155863 RepID=A0A832ZM99_9EURY|nr:precorrin-6A reductase [Methanococcaceae archaeon]HIP84345.1 precorrin-6A reductase [Methanothermococcus okinawensis]HIP91506.1 precorrin-6A reductase [Methanothermococcus okinawensis]
MRVLVMGGTRDGVEISKRLREIGFFTVTTTKTDYGSKLAEKYSDIVISREDTDKTLKDIVGEYNISLIIDATHPFAVKASQRAIEVSRECNIPYIRYERPRKRYRDVIYVRDFQEASKKALEIGEKNILYLGGIKNLKTVVDIVGEEKLIARVLPTSVPQALKLLPPKHVIGMEGVFSKDLNKCILLDYNCDILITKDSGDRGGLNEKVLGAREAGAKVIVVERPKLEYPLLFHSIQDLLKYVKQFCIK